METIILYVDKGKLFANGCIGLTDTADTIAYNNTLIGENFEKAVTDKLSLDNSASAIGYKGRYLITVDLLLDTRQFKMTFIDCQKNEVMATHLANQIKHEESRTEFMNVFYRQLEEYERVVDLVVLKEGIPPSI